MGRRGYLPLIPHPLSLCFGSRLCGGHPIVSSRCYNFKLTSGVSRVRHCSVGWEQIWIVATRQPGGPLAPPAWPVDERATSCDQWNHCSLALNVANCGERLPHWLDGVLFCCSPALLCIDLLALSDPGGL